MARDYVRAKSGKSRRGCKAEAAEGRWRWVIALLLIVLFSAGLFYLKQQGSKLAAESNENVATHNHAAAGKKMLHAASVAQKNSKALAGQSPSNLPEPRFDFYTMLPNGQTKSQPNNTTETPTPTVKPIAAPKASLPTPAAIQKPATVAAATTHGKPIPKLPSLTAANIARNKNLAAVETEKLVQTEIAQSGKAKPIVVSNPLYFYIIQIGAFKTYTEADQMKAEAALDGFETQIKTMGNRDKMTPYRVWVGPFSTEDIAKQKQRELADDDFDGTLIRQQ